MSPELSHSSYSLLNYTALCNANETIPGARSSVRSLNTIIMYLQCSVWIRIQAETLAHVFQYTDFFTYNRCQAILTYDPYRLTDANFFPTALQC